MNPEELRAKSSERKSYAVKDHGKHEWDGWPRQSHRDTTISNRFELHEAGPPNAVFVGWGSWTGPRFPPALSPCYKGGFHEPILRCYASKTADSSLVLSALSADPTE